MIEKRKPKIQLNVSKADMDLAWEHVTRSSRKEVKDWLALKIYGNEIYISDYLSLMTARLNDGEFSPKVSHYFYLPKADRSLRRFEFLETDDRLVYQHFCNIVIRNSYTEFINLNRSQRVYGNIPTDPTKKSPWVFKPVFRARDKHGRIISGQYDLFRHRVMKSYDEFCERARTSWLLRTDIRSFYYSVLHEELFKQLEEREWMPDKASRDLLHECLAKWSFESGRGLPVGYECSDQLANLYLNRLDSSLMQFRAHRYVDDTFIFVTDFEEVKHAIYEFDNALNLLGLQRNTAKTDVFCLRELSRDDLLTMLSESLSMFAQERDNENEEQRRQEELTELLSQSYRINRGVHCFAGEITDIRKATFVLNRLTERNVLAKSLAYQVIDHYPRPNYLYNAFEYLYRCFADQKFIEKLRQILNSSYEPQALHLLALRSLRNLCDPSVEDYVKSVVGRDGIDDWYLLRQIMKDVIEHYLDVFSLNELEPLMDHENPHVQVYAHWLIFHGWKSPEQKCKQINRMFQSRNQTLILLGIHLADLDGLLNDVQKTLVQSDVRQLFPEPYLTELDEFHRKFSGVFRIDLDPRFPIETYFGSFSETLRMIRMIYSSKNQDADRFVDYLHKLVEKLLVIEVNASLSDLHVDNLRAALNHKTDTELRAFVNVMEGELRENHASAGMPAKLAKDFERIFASRFDQIHRIERLRMRDEVFICYARKNEEWKCRVREHLRPYVDYHKVSVWSDDDIRAGQDWDREIKEALKRAKVAVLLMTSEFLASDYIRDDELPMIMRAEQNDGLEIVWIPVSPCGVLDTPIQRYQAAWKDSNRTLYDMIDEEKPGEIKRRLSEVCKDIANRIIT